MQEGASLFEPAISTRQSRHAPTSPTPSRWHNVGMRMPFSRAAARTVWPFGAVIICVSMVRVVTGIDNSKRDPHAPCEQRSHHASREAPRVFAVEFLHHAGRNESTNSHHGGC